MNSIEALTQFYYGRDHLVYQASAWEMVKMRDEFSAYRGRLLGFIKREEPEVKKVLDNLRREAYIAEEKPPSPQSICVHFIEKTILEPAETWLDEAGREKKPERAVLWWDVAYGAGLTAGWIYLAEEASRGDIAADIYALRITQLVSEFSNFLHKPFSWRTTADSADTYLKIRRDMAGSAGLFKPGLSSNKLVKSRVEELKKSLRDNLGQRRSPEMAIAGTELAQLVYDEIYPLAVQVSQAAPSF